MSKFPRSIILNACLLAVLGIVKSQIAFVEDGDIDKNKMNLDGRKPLYSPARCARHQLLYPGDQPNDWICDCAPTAVYYPESDGCYPAFRQGPCQRGEMLILYKDKVIPECVPNPCQLDGHFMIHGTCYEFGNNKHSHNPCPNRDLTYVLGVNPKTLMVDCVKLSMQLETRIGQEPTAAAAPADYFIDKAERCLPGSRLAAQGRCPAAV